MTSAPLGKFKKLIIDSEIASEFSKIANIRGKNPGKTIVFASGCYDILQPGHCIFFEQMQAFGDLVVIGLGRDSTISKLKPGRPINEQMNRAYLLAAMKPIDYVIIGGSEIEDGKIEFGKVIRTLLPDVFVLNDDDSALSQKTKLCKDLGIKLVLVKRIVPDFLKATSTTAIIDRVKAVY